MSKIWFTSDSHFGHDDIRRFCNRPFISVEVMDEILIKNWNEAVSPEDHIYHLGDFAWRNIRNYIEQLNGYIHLIRGSHDKQIGNLSTLFTEVCDLKKLVIEGNAIIMCHYQMTTWQASHYNSIQLYGHSHGRSEPVGKQMDVGVDTNGYYPYSFEDIIKIMKSKPDNFNLVKKKNESR